MAVVYILWHYTPSLPLAIVVTISFAALTAIHLFRLIQTGARFCIPFVVGGVFEAVGYGARAVAHYNTDATMPYAIQSLLILLGPILFAASIYMILGRIIRTMQAERYSLIPLKWLTKTFVLGDVTCFIIQGAGGGVMSGAKSQNDINIGQYVILAGLILQIIIFGFFVTVAGIVHYRLAQNPTYPSRAAGVHWQRHLFILYIVSALIAIRNIYRVVEYAWGSDGYIVQHEWVLYVFDAALMSMTLTLCIIWYSCHLGAFSALPRDVETQGEESVQLKRTAN